MHIADHLIESVISRTTDPYYGQYVSTADGMGVIIGKRYFGRGKQANYLIQLVDKGERRSYNASEVQPWLASKVV